MRYMMQPTMCPLTWIILTCLCLFFPTFSHSRIVQIEDSDAFRKMLHETLAVNHNDDDEFVTACIGIATAIALDLASQPMAINTDIALKELNGNSTGISPSSFLHSIKTNSIVFRWIKLEIDNCNLQIVTSDTIHELASDGIPAIDAHYRNTAANIKYGIMQFTAVTLNGNKVQYRFYLAEHPREGIAFHNVFSRWGETLSRTREAEARRFAQRPRNHLLPDTAGRSPAQIRLPREHFPWGLTLGVIGSILICLSILFHLLHTRH